MISKGKIVVDRDVPYLDGLLDRWFEVVRLPADEIVAGSVKDAVALIVRTRTRCGSQLLDGSSVSMVATATIGTDHIDMEWCAAHRIEVASAPGCNSGAVCQYVFAALDALDELPIAADGRQRTLGVVGVGNVGSKVAAEGRRMGFRVLENDPPRGLPLSLECLLKESDIVTVHIPLEGNENFADSVFFNHLKPGAVFINASRGEVVVEEALLEARESGKVRKLILDVWRNEPFINKSLLAAASIATPHIAGYSIEGKLKGTWMVVRALGKHFGIEELAAIPVGSLCSDEIVPAPYDILSDDAALRADPSSFERLRSNYRYRTERIA